MQSALFCAVLAVMPAASFRNQGIQLPNVGWLGLASSDAVVGVDGWNVWDHPALGTGYFTALGYQLWWETSAAVGLSTTFLSEGVEPVVSLRLSSGLRYNVLEDDVRPFVAAYVETLSLTTLAGGDIPINGFLQAPFFIGVRPALGVEWIVVEELSLQLDAGVTAFVVPSERAVGKLFLPAAIARLSVNVYF